MPIPVALQLYSVRDNAQKDYEATVRAVAKMGYAGVETAGFPNTTAQKAVTLFKELGLQVSSAHSGIPIGPDANKILDEIDTLGCKRLVSGKGPDDFASEDKIKATCEIFNEAAANAKKRGIAFGIHNHWWEFTRVGGKLPYDIAEKTLSRDVFFQIDTYWAKVGGENPAEMVKRYGDRVQLLHVKDGPCVKDQHMTAVGAGKMDFPAVIAEAKAAKWLIVELDSCATDMMEAVKASVDYLVRTKLGTGK